MAHPEDFESRAYGSGRNRQANIRVLSSFYLERQIGADGAVSQVQVNSQNRQRVLSVELTAREGGAAASGTLVMPFGLALDQGVVLSIDEGEPLPPLRFSTCLPGRVSGSADIRCQGGDGDAGRHRAQGEAGREQ